ncbi:phage antirepressor N-terminal domain-containing protein [uncultured Novosphingobium sp.]|uniref:phage antirepressor N-terminal domain-containing protein n=1 Tax=uncultured Novosphingobium sp. TaxID=292277 RepID=UPI00259724AB|nr:phage antirepressor N-terminal domain-containing protein [uncultured Novosphingobium sp.]
MASLEVVPFHQHQILTVKDSDGIYVVMKPIAETLGLTWRKQHDRITQHPVLSKGITLKVIPSAGGMQEMLTLDLEHFHGWLVTIDPRRVFNEDVRERIVMYQAEAFRAVFEHFHGKISRVQVTAQSARATVLLQNQYTKLLDKLVVTVDAGRRQALYSLIQSLGEQLGTEVPALVDLGKEAPQAPEILQEFWHVFEILTERGHRVNFSRKHELIAVNLPAMRAAIATEKLDFHIGADFGDLLEQCPSPKFIANKAVNTKSEDPSRAKKGKTVKCFVFQRFT